MSEHEKHDFDGIRYRVENKSPAVFRVLFSVLALWGLFFIAYFLFSGWSSTGEFARKKEAREAQKSAQQPVSGAHREGKRDEYLALGKKLFAERCVSCHGADARGGIGPDLTRTSFTYGRSEQAIGESIAGGRPGGMPAFKNDLSHEQIEGLVTYVLSL